MSEREKLSRAVFKTAWGYFFLYFNINLGALNVLPEFAGFLLFLSVIKDMADEEPETELLRVPAAVLAALHLAYWMGRLVNVDIGAVFPFVGIIMGTLNLYFHFQLLTNIASIAERYQSEDSEYSHRLLSLRTAQTVMLTVMMAVESIYPLTGEAGAYINIVIAIVYIIAGICLMSALFGLRKDIFFEERET